MNFFNLTNINRTINIKIWDSLKKFREQSFKCFNKQPEDWVVGFVVDDENVNNIDILSLTERRKCKSHENDNVYNMITAVVHEFVHICHSIYRGGNSSMRWLAEGLATYLSGQLKKYVDFDCTLEDLLNNKDVNYFNYNNMAKYLVENCQREYCLELARNKEMARNDTPKIYENVKANEEYKNSRMFFRKPKELN